MSRRLRSCAPPARQRGVALLVAILIVALGTIVAAAVAYENAMTARRGAATFAFDQAVLIHEGAEAIAAFGLQQIVQGGGSSGGNSLGKPQQPRSQSQQIYIGQGWDKPYGPLEVVPGVMLEASLEDLQGRFNVNTLVKGDCSADAVQVAAFTHLLEEVGLETKWVGYLIDWIDCDGQPQNGDGAEDSVYMGQDPPYRTANRYITSTTELLALPGFGRERYVALAPYITALPPTTTINVCTASAVVLNAYLPQGRSEGDQETLDKNRQNLGACFPTLQDYQAQFDPKQWAGASAVPGNPAQTGTPAPLGRPLQPGTQNGLASKFSENSVYFRLKSFITIGSTEFNLYSLLYMDARSAGPIQRSFTPD